MKRQGGRAEDPGRRGLLLEVAFAGLLLAGIVLPYAQAIPWLVGNGTDLPLLFDEIFATRISSFFGWDVIVTVIVLLFAVALDTSLSKGQQTLAVLAAFLGASVGLPMYLLLRQRNQRRRPAITRDAP